jgi:hypothetical protein
MCRLISHDLENPASFSCPRDSTGAIQGDMMTTTADLTAYGPIIEASERLLDSLPVDGMILKHDQEIVAVNAKAAEKGLVQGMKCYEGWPTVKKMCQWCRAKKALKSGKVIDYMVRAMPNEEGEMVIVNEGGFIMDAHWYLLGSATSRPSSARRSLKRSGSS